MQELGIPVGVAQPIQQQHPVNTIHTTSSITSLIIITGSGFTLKSSKGACAVSSGTFTCAPGNTATVFTVCPIPSN